MKNFICDCGQPLFFENTRCLNCKRQVGFDPDRMGMVALEAEDYRLRLCRNAADFDVCNWVVRGPEPSHCLSCNLNHTIPNLLLPKRRRWWKSLEIAKRRLIYSLLRLGLPVSNRDGDESGLAFSFIEDQRTNPDAFEQHVNTGHNNGMITINIAEADGVRMEMTRQYTGELYRTLLGHFRHESGHYYFERLVGPAEDREAFRALFGDERRDYAQALQDYYANTGTLARAPGYISLYAQAHPLEDWAEVWAHYLHMVDTLETAGDYNIPQGMDYPNDIEAMLLKWSELTMMLNSLNRSMGLEDAYPFILSNETLAKLRYVHGLIRRDAPT